MVIAPAASSQTGRCVRCMRAPTNWPPTGPIARIVGVRKNVIITTAPSQAAPMTMWRRRRMMMAVTLSMMGSPMPPDRAASDGAICRATTIATSCRGRVPVLD